MFNKEEIKKLQEGISELSESIKVFSERQNSQYNEIITRLTKLEDNRSEDTLYEEVVEVVQDSMKASASFIQHSLGIGYSKAARLLDLLEKKGVVGPSEGSKPRKVFIKKIDGEQ